MSLQSHCCYYRSLCYSLIPIIGYLREEHNHKSQSKLWNQHNDDNTAGFLPASAQSPGRISRKSTLESVLQEMEQEVFRFHGRSVPSTSSSDNMPTRQEEEELDNKTSFEENETAARSISPPRDRFEIELMHPPLGPSLLNLGHVPNLDTRTIRTRASDSPGASTPLLVKKNERAFSQAQEHLERQR